MKLTQTTTNVAVQNIFPVEFTQSTKVELTEEEWSVLDHAIEGMCAANIHIDATGAEQ